MRKVYASDGIAVSYDPRRCIHAARCVEGAPEVFDPNAKPWIRPGNAAAGTIAGVVARCPTGSLRYERRDGGPAEAVPAEITISVEKNGPIYVRGPMPLVDPAGASWSDAGHRYALCRCGASANKPYCDRAHERIGFAG